MKTNNSIPNTKPNDRDKSCWLNTRRRFGWGSIVLHWLMALLLLGSYLLGDYMVTLDYYDSWYHRAPAIHKAIGVIICLLFIFRVLWVIFQARPEAIGHSFPIPLLRLELSVSLQQKIAHSVHVLLYSLILIMLISGYLISTAKGQGISVFDWLEVPALLPDDAARGETAGKVHKFAGLAFMVTASLHALAALLHHFVLRDDTLKRMIRVTK